MQKDCCKTTKIATETDPAALELLTEPRRAELSRQSGATLLRGLPGDVQRCCAGRLLLHQNPCRSGNLHSRNTAVFSHVK